mgnify:CR=1 FL=1
MNTLKRMSKKTLQFVKAIMKVIIVILLVLISVNMHNKGITIYSVIEGASITLFLILAMVIFEEVINFTIKNKEEQQ